MTLGWEVGAGGTCRERGHCSLQVMLVSMVMTALTTWLPQMESQTSVWCTRRVEPGGTADM